MFRRIVQEHVLTVFDCPRVGVVSVVSFTQTFLGAFPFTVGLGFEPFDDLAQRLRFRCSLSCLVSVLSPVSFPAKASTIVQMRHVMRMSVVPGSIAIRLAALLFDVFRA